MISANEARIITNDNEYKNILREEKLIAEKELRKAKVEEHFLKEVFIPLGEAITKRAIEGYTDMTIKVYNSMYISGDYADYNIEAIQAYRYLDEPRYIYQYTYFLTRKIIEHLKPLGYKMNNTIPCCWYTGVGYIRLSW